MHGRERIAVVLGLVLAAVVVGLYAQVGGHSFVEFDDPIYLTENPHIHQGLTWDGIRWAFTTRWSFLWHPITWLSYLADYEIHGLANAGPVLLVNVGLHAATCVVLLTVLVRMTGRLWPCVLAVALFALHPMRVESVAWAAARKDVLCMFFFALTLFAWVAYVARRSIARYAAVLLLYSLCLASKPTLVTLPVLLLLLDAWPLGRVSIPPGREASLPLGEAVLEKLPLLVLALAATARSISIQGDAHNLWVEDPGLQDRMGNAIVSCVLYLGRTFWPTDLALAHLTPLQLGEPGWSPEQVGAAFGLVAGITLVVLRMWRTCPALAIGWLWFLVALGPALHIVPWGLRVMHDRYMHVPHVGLFVALAFGAAGLAGDSKTRRRVVGAVSAFVLVGASAITWREIGYWRDSFALFDRALVVESRNAVALYGRSVAWAKAGRRDEAIRDLRAALAVHPRYADAHSNLGYLLLEAGQVDAAIASLDTALAIDPSSVKAWVNLGNAYRARGDAVAARTSLDRAVAVAGDSPVGADAYYWLGVMQEGASPGDAAASYQRALALDGHHSWSLLRLGMLFEASGRGGEALAFYRRVGKGTPPWPDALARRAWVLATDPDPRVRDVLAALRAAETLGSVAGTAMTGYTLGAVRAAAGDFAGALAALDGALAALPSDAPEVQRDEFLRCRRRYAAGQRYAPGPAEAP